MTPHMIHGVPLAMQQDGWWLDDPEQLMERRKAARRRWDGLRAALLLCLIVLGDVLVWNVVPGISLAVLGLAVTLCGLAVAKPDLSLRTRVGVACGAVLALLPLVELVQPLSLLIALVAALAGVAVLAGVRWADVVRATARAVWVMPVQSAVDGVEGIRGIGRLGQADPDLRGLVMGWALPVLATCIFCVLLIGANPVLDRFLSDLAQIQGPDLHPVRLWLWGLLAVIFWPVLVAYRMRERLSYRAPQRVTVRRPGLVNAQSVARSLVAFNTLFAMQTGMDVLFLYGDATLPEGISPAAYAHRGAYPLLATALLAGVFAVIARPFVSGQPVVRILMMVWLAQTLALVFASVWRLDMYVDAYGLTRLRLAAYVWMALVAVGLGVVAHQVWADKPTQWMLVRCGALGAVVLYMAAFVNFDHVVATHNLTRDVPEDRKMLCKLSEGAIPAIRLHSNMPEALFCAREFYEPSLFTPQDWREWGFRNWRVRRSLAAMTYSAESTNQ